ncbi:hypothetical protein [Sinisalibacter lacisalsi]|uniref:Uncharacterized protein n=1 Tax=Sinisalibacter lacisalsi TaxID=1526570 RepID=A0ABQ1QDM1_9RHOB|nr:hypothetical protein [Sinisalibacter lacisalsi]GGD23114.1 hypothetical protein GCM10011358_04560 [Sinisalibacter lacisalsi]
MRDTNAPLPDTAFWRAYGGAFTGTLKWEQFDALFDRLATAGGDWFVFDPTGDAPEAPAADFSAALAAARACVEQVRGRSYCGAVFADDFDAPGFVKVFDPYKMGGVCGGSGERVLPRWILSRLAPDPLPPLPETPAKKGLLARLIG